MGCGGDFFRIAGIDGSDAFDPGDSVTVHPLVGLDGDLVTPVLGMSAISLYLLPEVGASVSSGGIWYP